MQSARSVLLIVLTGIASAALGLLVARMLSQKPPVLQSGTWLPQPRTLAPFQLTDLAGKPFGNAELTGHGTLVFFGYTSCPDVCPTTLSTLRAVQQRRPIANLSVLFVTVDPQHDTPAVLAQYLSAFDREFGGLYGPKEALAPLARSLGVFIERQAGLGGNDTFDHSGTLYLLDRKGRMAAVFSPPLAAAALASDLATIARASAL